MRLSVALTFLAFTILCNTSAQVVGEFNRNKYVQEIRQERKLKDIDMCSGENSPIPVDERKSFKKLNYFRPKAAYRKLADFNRFDQATHFLMKTTTERLPEYLIYGEATFRHRGKKHKLTVYQNIELVKKQGYEKYLFIPFNDNTNGKETYGGGRYLDVYETGENTLLLDFNKAYNPSCAYNHKFSCPIPPEANYLKIKVKSGEKKLHP